MKFLLPSRAVDYRHTGLHFRTLAKLETVLNDESLLNDFYTILDEQKAFCHQLLYLLDPECKEGALGELDEIRELFNLVCALA